MAARSRPAEAVHLLQALRRRTRAAVGMPPPLLDGPDQAWARRREHAAFRCRPPRCALVIGLRVESWNPFAETSRDILSGGCTGFEGSILGRYYDRFQPRNAAEAIIGSTFAPPEFRHWPPIVAFCSPWESLTPQAAIDKVRAWTERDYHETGAAGLTLDDGFKYFGPVTPALGAAEFERLGTLAHGLRVDGYLRRFGDVQQVVLKRGQEYLAVMSGGGMHRTVAAAAAGIGTIPARPRLLLDVDGVESWPNVESGLWSAEAARAYCDHLFDFDYAAWAAAQGIVP